MRATKLRIPDDTPAKRRLLGLAVLLLTLGGGYVVAQQGAMPSPLAVVALAQETEADDAEAEETRATPTTAEIMAEIDEVAARHRLPARLVAAIVAVESEFNPRAVSRRGAQGLMQLMPATAASLDVQDSFDLQENLDGGARHLRVLMDRYHSDLPLVLAAYNAGDRAVIAYRGVPPYPQTRRYVIRVLRRYDPEAARAATHRIYGARPTPPRQAPPLPWRLVSLDSPASVPVPRPLGPWWVDEGPPPQQTGWSKPHGSDSP